MELFNSFLDMRQSSSKKKGEESAIPPYIEEYFNVKPCFSMAASNDLAITRVINALIDMVNGKTATLPKYLVVILDHDLLDIIHCCEGTQSTTIQTITYWFVWQIYTVVCRKIIDLFEKKPGSLSSFNTKIVFVKMVCRVDKHGDDTIPGKLNKLRPHFNDTLNNTVAKVGQYILTINSCNAYEDYDNRGFLSVKGKGNFWLEMDDLIQHFDFNKIKLLPNPKNPPRQRPCNSHSGDCSRLHAHRGNTFHDRPNDQPRRKLPTPPPHHCY